LDLSHPLSAWRPAEHQAAVGTLGRLRFAAEIGGRGLNMNFGLRKIWIDLPEREIDRADRGRLATVRQTRIYLYISILRETVAAPQQD
jgi:hypothetical protein